MKTLNKSKWSVSKNSPNSANYASTETETEAEGPMTAHEYELSRKWHVGVPKEAKKEQQTPKKKQNET